MRKGFSLIELMIVIAIIAIAGSIAVPSFLRMTATSKRTVCISNLRKITASVEQWAFDRNISNGTSLSAEQEDDMYNNYFRGGKPACPAGGEYLINPVGENPQVRCTLGSKGSPGCAMVESEGHQL